MWLSTAGNIKDKVYKVYIVPTEVTRNFYSLATEKQTTSTVRLNYFMMEKCLHHCHN